MERSRSERVPCSRPYGRRKPSRGSFSYFAKELPDPRGVRLLESHRRGSRKRTFLYLTGSVLEVLVVSMRGEVNTVHAADLQQPDIYSPVGSFMQDFERYDILPCMGVPRSTTDSSYPVRDIYIYIIYIYIYKIYIIYTRYQVYIIYIIYTWYSELTYDIYFQVFSC